MRCRHPFVMMSIRFIGKVAPMMTICFNQNVMTDMTTPAIQLETRYMGSADGKKQKRPTDKERRLVDELCVEERDEEWQSYVRKMIAEIQKHWTEEDFDRHTLIHNQSFALIEWNTRQARRDLRKRGES